MDYIIDGQNKLYGQLHVYGAKNCALALLGATVLTDEEVVLNNCPQIDDVENMLKILHAMGKSVTRSGDTIFVAGALSTTDIPVALSHLLRGSGLLLGGTVSRHGEAFLPATGGCAIGKRPIDIHLDGLSAMGVQVLGTPDGTQCKGFPAGCSYNLRFPSVGATENLLCAAVLAKGTVTLTNCALEPEVVALQKLLQKMGAKIDGVGGKTVTVRGVSALHGAEFDVIPDRIVAATYLACVAAAGGTLALTSFPARHLEAFTSLLSSRFKLQIFDDVAILEATARPRDYGTTVTAPYPAFPTDLQQILLSLCALSNGGQSTIAEKLFENRLLHNATQLCQMGAQITVRGDTAQIVGTRLHGADVAAGDLRGGAGLVVAALGANGQTVVRQAQHILRGYNNFAQSLNAVGASITPV